MLHFYKGENKMKQNFQTVRSETRGGSNCSILLCRIRGIASNRCGCGLDLADRVIVFLYRTGPSLVFYWEIVPSFCLRV